MILLEVSHPTEIERPTKFHQGRRPEFSIRGPGHIPGGLESGRALAKVDRLVAGTFVKCQVGNEVLGGQVGVKRIDICRAQPLLEFASRGVLAFIPF